MFDPVLIIPLSANSTSFALIARTILPVAPGLPVMFYTLFRLRAAAAAARQLARLCAGVIPIRPVVLYSLIDGTAALASLNQDAAQRGFGPPISLMKTKQALSGIEPILHCHEFVLVEFTIFVPIFDNAHRPARTWWYP